MTYETLLCETQENILTITMNRPEKMNAINKAMWDDLMAEFDRAEKDPEVRAIILAGSGKAFCSGWDVKDPDLQNGRIVYHLAGDLWLYDLAAGQASRIPISLASDFDQLREKWVENPMDYLSSAHLHPNGESAVMTARGRVFVIPASRTGRLVQVSRREGVR